MKHTLAAILVAILSIGFALTSRGASTPEQSSSVETFIIDETGDMMMPSLSELLGEKVDDLGEFDVNSEIKSQLVDYASSLIGTRYRRGGKSPVGFDCSGFTSYVFRNFGYTLAPASRAQGLQGQAIDLADVEVGDLMFFSGRRGGKTVGHVGMVVEVDREAGTCKFIHSASSKGVVIQHFPDGGYYSRRFLQARRVLDDAALVASRD